VNIWQSYKLERGCLTPFARLANTPPTLRSSIATNSVSTLSVSSEHTRFLLVVSCSFFLSYAPVRWIKLVKSQLSRACKVTAYRIVWLSVVELGAGIQCSCITGLVFMQRDLVACILQNSRLRSHCPRGSKVNL